MDADSEKHVDTRSKLHKKNNERHREVIKAITSGHGEVIERIDVGHRNIANAVTSGAMYICLTIYSCTCVAILCLQDAPLLSKNSIVPAGMVIVPLVIVAVEEFWRKFGDLIASIIWWIIIGTPILWVLKKIWYYLTVMAKI